MDNPTPPVNILEQARKGDARAQYMLSMQLQQGGHFEESRKWLDKAVAAGLPDALYTISTIDLQGKDGAGPGANTLQRIADNLHLAQSGGSQAASRLLALLHYIGLAVEQDQAEAIKALVTAAFGGYAPAAREAAVLLLMSSGNDARLQGIACSMLRHAASRNDWIAAFLCVREALRGRFFLKKSELELLAKRLSGGGTPCATSFDESAMACLPDTAPVSMEKTTMEGLAELIGRSVSQQSTHIKEMLHEVPTICAYRSVLSPLECDYLMAISAGLMSPSKVVDDTEGRAQTEIFRTSDGGVITPVNQDLVSAVLAERIAGIADIRAEQAEFFSVLRYHPGQEYRPHHDYLPEDENDYSQVRRSGQRKATILTYLDDAFEGGETAFPLLKLEFKGAPGDCLYFENVTASGEGIESSLHAGLPVRSGIKWLATLWLREKPFWYWV